MPEATWSRQERRGLPVRKLFLMTLAIGSVPLRMEPSSSAEPRVRAMSKGRGDAAEEVSDAIELSESFEL